MLTISGRTICDLILISPEILTSLIFIILLYWYHVNCHTRLWFDINIIKQPQRFCSSEQNLKDSSLVLISNIKFVKHEHMFSIAQWNLILLIIYSFKCCVLAKVLNWSCHYPQFLVFFLTIYMKFSKTHVSRFNTLLCFAFNSDLWGVGALQFAPLWRLHYSNLVFWGPFAAQLLDIQLGCGDVGLRREELDYCCYFHSHDPISTYNVLLVKMVYSATVLLHKVNKQLNIRF